jgi:hypothetical protein
VKSSIVKLNMASNTARNIPMSVELYEKETEPILSFSSISSTLPGRPSLHRQKPWPSVEVTSTRVQVAFDTEVKDDIDSEFEGRARV